MQNYDYKWERLSVTQFKTLNNLYIESQETDMNLSSVCPVKDSLVNANPLKIPPQSFTRSWRNLYGGYSHKNAYFATGRSWVPTRY